MRKSSQSTRLKPSSAATGSAAGEDCCDYTNEEEMNGRSPQVRHSGSVGIGQANRDHHGQTRNKLPAFCGQWVTWDAFWQQRKVEYLSFRDNGHSLSPGFVRCTELRAFSALYHSGSLYLLDEAESIFLPSLWLREVKPPVQADTASERQSWDLRPDNEAEGPFS